MKIRNIIQNFFAMLLLVGFSGMHTPTYTEPQLPFQITEDDLKKAEAEIEAFRSSLSADERTRFDNDVQELQKALEGMSEKELEEFFTQLATMEPEAAMPPAPGPQPVAPQPVAITPPAEAPKKEVKKSDTKPAEQLIDAIIARIDSFMLKVKSIQEFDRKLITWQQEGKVQKGQSTLNWEKLQGDIELFKQKLMKLKDKDQKTKEFRYLPELIENKELYEKLSELNSSLSNYEPNIVISGFSGVNQVNKNSKNFIRRVIDTLTQALYTHKLADAFDKMVEKYEPVAKKIKEQEERKDQQALEASRRGKQLEGAKTVGQREAERAPYQAPAAMGGGYGSSPSGYMPSSGGGFSSGSSFNTASSGFGSEPTQPSSTSGFGANGGGFSSMPSAPSMPSYAPESSATKSLASTTAEALPANQGAAPAPATQQQATAAEQKDEKAVGRLVERVDKSLEDIATSVADAKFKNLERAITDASAPIDFGTIKRLAKIAEEVDGLKSKLKRVESGIKNSPAAQQKAHKNSLKESFESHIDALGDFVNQLRNIETKWASLQKDVSADSKYAYFGDTSAPASAQTKAELKQPINILTIKKDIDEVVGTIQSIIQ